jgi:hypothetical protein
MSQPSPCFVRKRDTLTAANFINLCHAKEDPGGIGYVLVTVSELETGRKIATRTIVADHDSMVRRPGMGTPLITVSGLVSRLWYRRPFDQ